MRLLAILGAFFFSGMVQATPLHNIVVFGDSLSDNGNLYAFMNHQLPPSPPYFEGRFSNGPVWIEHLAELCFPKNPNAHLLDYAYGGAGVSEDENDDDVLFTLRRELKSYFQTRDKANPDDLYVVWIGANNYLALPEEVEKTLREVNDGITKALLRLASSGAKHILVVNIPDLGNTPAATEFDAAETMAYFSKRHNDALNDTLEHMKQKYPEVDWLFFDMNSAFGEVMANPQVYGFSNVTGTCSDLMSNSLTKKSVIRMATAVKANSKTDACEGYLFFDLVHPTALAHKLLAERVKQILDESGLEFSEAK